VLPEHPAVESEQRVSASYWQLVPTSEEQLLVLPMPPLKTLRSSEVQAEVTDPQLVEHDP